MDTGDPLEKSPISIEFSLASHIHVAKMRVWNYNRSLTLSTMGAKDAKVYYNGKLIWEGLLKKAIGNAAFDYSTTIVLDCSVQVDENDQVENDPGLTIDPKQNVEQLSKSIPPGLSEQDTKQSTQSFTDLHSESLFVDQLLRRSKLPVPSRIEPSRKDLEPQAVVSNSEFRIPQVKKINKDERPLWLIGSDLGQQGSEGKIAKH